MRSISILTRKSFADVTRRKGRTILMVLGILIGVMGLTAVDVASDTYSRDLVALLAPVDVPNITFNVNAIPASVVTDLQRTPNVQAFQIRTQLFSQWHLAGNAGSVSLEIDSYRDWNHIQVGSFQLTSGRLPGPGEIIMATKDRFVQPVALGDTVAVEALDGHLHSLRVVGLAYTDEQSSDQAIGYMSTAGIQQLALIPQAPRVPQKPGQQGGPPPFSQQIMVKTRTGDYYSVLQTSNQFSMRLTTAHIPVLFTHSYATAGQENEQFTIKSSFTITLIFVAIALLLVFFMIFNTITIMLAEQMRIIGTMKALGGTRFAISRSYLLSVGIYALLGTVLGLALGLVLCEYILTQVADQAHLDLRPFQISPWVTLTSLAVGLLIPLFAALPSLWIGTRITVHQAMATYGVSTGAGERTTTWGHHLTWIPQTAWLGLRSTFRKRGRTVVTLLVLTISAAVFMAVQIANESVSETTSHNLHLYSYDASLGLGSDPIRGQRLLSTIQSLPDVAQIEQPVGRTFVTMNQGEMEIDSLSASSSLYHPQVIAGHWLTNSDAGIIVLSDTVAQRLRIHVGENVSFHLETAQAELVTWRVSGIVHEIANATSTAVPHVELGLAFTTPKNVQRLSLPANKQPEIWLLVHDRSTPALQHLSNQLVSIFNQAGLQPNFSIRTQAIEHDAASQVLTYVIFDTLAILIGLVGLLGLANALAAAVFERRLEIGILRSLGATGWRIGAVFCVEGLALVVIAWCAGTLLGVPGGVALVNILDYFSQPFDIAFNPLALPLTLLFMIAIALLASFGPALSASRIRIAETLRYE